MITRNKLDVEIGDVWQFSSGGFSPDGKWEECFGGVTTFLVVNITLGTQDGKEYVKNIWVLNLNDFNAGLRSYGFEVAPHRYRLIARI